MDRAAFLRSLNFLRPLPPGAWDACVDGVGNNDNGGGDGGEEPYSGSTITPPTPTKNDSMLMLLEDSSFVVSIEPNDNEKCWGKKGTNGGAAAEANNTTTSTGHRDQPLMAMGSGRKRGRGNGMPAKSKGSVGPLFFQNRSDGEAKKSDDDGEEAAVAVDDEPADESKEKANNDGDEEDDDESKEDDTDADQREDNEGAEKEDGAAAADLRFRINSDDPSLCTFEAAIVKKSLPSEQSPGEGEQRDVLFTPKGHRQRNNNTMGRDGMESKALIFRFGNRFVFQVDESAILELKFEPGFDQGGGDGYNGSKTKTNGSAGSPASKRQRNEGDGATNNSPVKASGKGTKLPPSLIVSFRSCAFRVFSLDDDSGSDNLGPKDAAASEARRLSSRIWGTLAKPAESAESRIIKARSVLMQQFEIENRERRRSNGPSLWKMAPPGSGLAFESWPESFESSSFHSDPPKYMASDFLNEKWSRCMDENKTIECPKTSVSSPQKSSSPAKTSAGSSTHFEPGQNEHTPTKNGTSQSHPEQIDDVVTNKNGAKNAESNSSELTHETNQNEKEDCADAPMLEESESKETDADDKSKENETEETKDADQDSAGKSGDCKIEKGEADISNSSNENSNSQSWKDDIYSKYQQFQKSTLYMERAMDPAANTSQHDKKGANMSQPLTSCAETLSSSYLTAKEFMNTSQLCEEEIESSTTEMEGLLEKMFPARPARGRNRNAVTVDQSEDCQSRIEELMKSRKEAVAAKFALLMTPKR